MHSVFKPITLILLSLLVVKINRAQEIFPSKNIGVNLKGAFLVEEPSYYGFEFIHGWRFSEFFGVQVGGGIENSDNFSELKIVDERFQRSNIKYYDLSGKCNYVNAKITGYLPLLYNDDDNIDVELYGTFFGGVASLRLLGQIDLMEPDEQIVNEADQRTHVFYGFDFGVVAAFSDLFAMRVFIGGNSINYGKLRDVINDQNANRPFRHKNIENEPYWGVGLIYTYSRRSR